MHGFFRNNHSPMKVGVFFFKAKSTSKPSRLWQNSFVPQGFVGRCIPEVYGVKSRFMGKPSIKGLAGKGKADGRGGGVPQPRLCNQLIQALLELRQQHTTLKGQGFGVGGKVIPWGPLGKLITRRWAFNPRGGEVRAWRGNWPQTYQLGTDRG